MMKSISSREVVALPELLRNASLILLHLGDTATEIDDVIGQIVLSHQDLPFDASILQSVDVLRQSIFSVAQVLEDLSNQDAVCGNLIPIDVVDGAPLQKIRDSLLAECCDSLRSGTLSRYQG